MEKIESFLYSNFPNYLKDIFLWLVYLNHKIDINKVYPLCLIGMTPTSLPLFIENNPPSPSVSRHANGRSHHLFTPLPELNAHIPELTDACLPISPCAL